MKALGLRFERRDAKLLRQLAARVRGGEFGEASSNVFEQAARAAESGEPLEVYYDEPVEVVQLAASYIPYGVTRPVIEELSGHNARR